MVRERVVEPDRVRVRVRAGEALARAVAEPVREALAERLDRMLPEGDLLAEEERD